jgi:hypothetical protein
VTEFAADYRKRCRKCECKLPAPVSLPQRAFCCRGCHDQFYRRRCVICEIELPRGPANRKTCRKPKCRNTSRQFDHLYGWHESTRMAHDSQNVERPSEKLDSMRVESRTKTGRPSPKAPARTALIRNAIHTEFFGGGQWCEVVSQDGAVRHVTRLWSREAQTAKLAA